MYTLRDRNYKFVHLYTISLQTTWFCIPYKPREIQNMRQKEGVPMRKDYAQTGKPVGPQQGHEKSGE